MKQYSLFIRVARTLIFWTASHTLIAWSITMVRHIKKSYANWPGPCCYGLPQHEYLALSVLVQTDKD